MKKAILIGLASAGVGYFIWKKWKSKTTIIPVANVGAMATSKNQSVDTPELVDALDFPSQKFNVSLNDITLNDPFYGSTSAKLDPYESRDFNQRYMVATKRQLISVA